MTGHVFGSYVNLSNGERGKLDTITIQIMMYLMNKVVPQIIKTTCRV